MYATQDRLRLFVSGQQIELWENPEAPFGFAPEDLESYAMAGEWVALFNAVMLRSSAAEDEAGLGA
jgi:hypothetical protein